MCANYTLELSHSQPDETGPIHRLLIEADGMKGIISIEGGKVSLFLPSRGQK